MRRRRGDQRKIAQSAIAMFKRARDRRGGHGQQVDFGAQLFQLLLLAHAEALFLIDDHQAQILELDVRLQQLVRADDDVDLAVGQALAARRSLPWST